MCLYSTKIQCHWFLCAMERPNEKISRSFYHYITSIYTIHLLSHNDYTSWINCAFRTTSTAICCLSRGKTKPSPIFFPSFSRLSLQYTQSHHSLSNITIYTHTVLHKHHINSFALSLIFAFSSILFQSNTYKRRQRRNETRRT